MPYTAQRKDIESMFANEGFQFTNIDVSIDPFTSRNPSYCFVDLLTPDDAERAMRNLSGKPFHGRPLKIKPCIQRRPKDRRPHSDRLESTRWNQISRERPDWLQPQTFTDKSAIDLLASVRENRRLFVSGLPKPTDNHTSDLEIRELFKGFQVEAVSKVKWPGRESQPKHGWYAFVDLSTAAEAQRAMNQMHGIEKWGGNLTVNIASGTPKKVLDTMQRKEEQVHKEQQEDIHLNYD